jgi:Flp pilus assembly protein protease CpaA
MALRMAAFACLALVFVAMLHDWKTRKIPNYLTLGGILFGIAIHALTGGMKGAGFSLLGAAMCVVLPAIQFARGDMGGGDVKLFAAVGAMVGPSVGFDAEAITFALALLVLWPYRLVRAGWRGKTVKVAPVILGPVIFVGLLLSMARHGAFA